MQTKLFEPIKGFNPQSRGCIKFKSLSINERINYHSNCCYAPHYINNYSYMMGIDNCFSFELKYGTNISQPNFKKPC